jgi:hypothetical protein
VIGSGTAGNTTRRCEDVAAKKQKNNHFNFKVKPS